MSDSCTSGAPPCRHCGAASYRRKMCRTCFGRRRKVRARYPAKHNNGRRFRHKDTRKQPPSPELPTLTRPGSEDRIRVLEDRANGPDRTSLFHPLDVHLRRMRDW